MVGVLIIGFLRNGLNLLQVSPFVQQVIIGLVIAIAVAADTVRPQATLSRSSAPRPSPSPAKTALLRCPERVSGSGGTESKTIPAKRCSPNVR